MINWNRRQFLKGAAVAPVVGITVGEASTTEPRREVRPRADLKDTVRTQVLVVGAGASGVPAAIAAARAGAKVILIEEDGVPGGAPVDMFVTMVCGGPIVGIYGEMIALLDRDFSVKAVPQVVPPDGPWFTPSAYVHVISRLLRAEPNLDLWCYSPMTGVLVSEGSRNRIRGVAIHRPDGHIQTIEADVVIDATGAGMVASMAGCECRYGTEARSEFNEPIGPDTPSEQVQLCTLMLISQRLRSDAKIDIRKLHSAKVSPTEAGNANLQWAGTVSCQDTRSPITIAEAHAEALLKIENDIAYLYDNGFVAHVAPKLGIRETRRVVGDYILTLNDLISEKRPDDTVALGTYTVDVWGQRYGVGETSVTIPPGGYGIPLRALLTKGMKNLMVVGKCLSATHLAMSAVRVQCIVAQMGQAAGIAAALAVKKETDLRSVPVKDIQAKLAAMGIPIFSPPV